MLRLLTQSLNLVQQTFQKFSFFDFQLLFLMNLQIYCPCLKYSLHVLLEYQVNQLCENYRFLTLINFVNSS